MLIAVNYHYLRDESYKDGIYPITKAALNKQIKKLASRFRIIGQDEIHLVNSSNEDLCILTFDDGLREQFDVGYQVIKELGLKAIFFPSTRPIQNKEYVLPVHLLHHIRANYDTNILLELLQKFSTIDQKNIYEKAKAQYRYDHQLAATFKYVYNFELSNVQRVSYINLLINELEIDLSQFNNDLYMTERQISILGQEGMIGSHCHNHNPLSSLSLDEVRDEMIRSKQILESIISVEIDAISYPYGGPSSYTDDVLSLANDTGYRMGFTMTRGLNSKDAKMMRLKRFDTNDVYGGKTDLLTEMLKEQ